MSGNPAAANKIWKRIEPANGNGPPRSPDRSFFDHIIAMRRNRDRIFGADLFGEPAWDILLNLMVARFDECGMAVDVLAEAIGHPESTTLRFVEAMSADRLLEHDNQPVDPRKGIVRLSDDAAKAMLAFFRESPAIAFPHPESF